MLGCRCWPERGDEAAVSFLVAPGSRQVGDKCRMRTCPPHSNRHARWRRQCARTSRRRDGPKDTARQQFVRVDVAESGRRRVPSAGKRALVADGERGVNDPGVGWPARPRAIVCGGRSRPAVSMSDEAREQPPSPGGSVGTGRYSFGLRASHQREWPDGHHVREDARSARRRARFSAALRPRDTRGSRVWVSRPGRLSLSVSARP
jgi:hypothetical protein